MDELGKRYDDRHVIARRFALALVALALARGEQDDVTVKGVVGADEEADVAGADEGGLDQAVRRLRPHGPLHHAGEIPADAVAAHEGVGEVEVARGETATIGLMGPGMTPGTGFVVLGIGFQTNVIRYGEGQAEFLVRFGALDVRGASAMLESSMSTTPSVWVKTPRTALATWRRPSASGP